MALARYEAARARVLVPDPVLHAAERARYADPGHADLQALTSRVCTPADLLHFQKVRRDLPRLPWARLMEELRPPFPEPRRDGRPPGPEHAAAIDRFWWTEKVVQELAVWSKTCDESGLSPMHQTELAQSMISVEEAVRAGIWTETVEPVIDVLRGVTTRPWRKRRRRAAKVALVYPYFRPGASLPERIRAKVGRGYRQPRLTSTAIYFPPQTVRDGRLQDLRLPLIVTEGEKKTLALDGLGVCAVGLPGVWNAADTAAKPAHVLHRWLREDVAIEGRKVVIAFDRDILANANVQLAADRLRGMLLAAGARAVCFVDWSTAAWANAKGIDDFAQAAGRELAWHLLDRAPERLTAPKLRLPASIAAARELTAQEKIVLAALYTTVRISKKTPAVSQGRLAELVSGGRGSEKSIGRIVARLEKAGYLRRERPRPERLANDRWRRKPDRYRLLAKLDESIEDLLLDIEELKVNALGGLILAVLRQVRTITRSKLRERLGRPKDRTLRAALQAFEDRLVRTGTTIQLVTIEQLAELGQE